MTFQAVQLLRSFPILIGMKRRTLLSALASLPLVAAGPSFAQDQILNEVSKYLNQLRSIKGRFTQINANGSRSRGNYYLRRPGFIKFEYDGDQAVVLADGVNIGVIDSKSNQGAQKYPIGTTPLRFLLQDKIDLTRDNLIAGADSKNGFTNVVLRDPRKPRQGSMTLVLSNRPPALTRWIIKEKNGQQTTVILETIEPATGLQRRFFSIEAAEIRMRQKG